MVLTINRKIVAVSLNSYIKYIYKKKIYIYIWKAALTVEVLLVLCVRGGSWQIALLFL